MSESTTPQLLDRPEPHFAEGRLWPRAGRLGRVLWVALVVLLGAAFVAACMAEMVVQLPLTGSVAAVTEDGQRQVQLFAEGPTAVQLQVGQPVRVRIDKTTGWGCLVAKRDRPQDTNTKVVVTLLGPEELFRAPVGQACQGHVLIGFVPMIRGLWQLAINQAPRPTHGDLHQLREHIPAKLRMTQRYKEIVYGLERENR